MAFKTERTLSLSSSEPLELVMLVGVQRVDGRWTLSHQRGAGTAIVYRRATGRLWTGRPQQQVGGTPA